MVKIDKAPMFVRVGNVLTTTLLRAGFKFNGMGLKDHPTYQFTVRGRHSETVTARELPPREAALVLREDIKNGNPFGRNFGVTRWKPHKIAM